MLVNLVMGRRGKMTKKSKHLGNSWIEHIISFLFVLARVISGVICHIYHWIPIKLKIIEPLPSFHNAFSSAIFFFFFLHTVGCGRARAHNIVIAMNSVTTHSPWQPGLVRSWSGHVPVWILCLSGCGCQFVLMTRVAQFVASLHTCLLSCWKYMFPWLPSEVIYIYGLFILTWGKFPSLCRLLTNPYSGRREDNSCS